MPKNTNNQPQPKEQVGIETDSGVTVVPSPALSLVPASETLMGQAMAQRNEALANKAKLLGTVRTQLAEVAKLTTADQASGIQAEKAAKPALALYQARTNGSINAEELSEELGRAFGWKRKGITANNPQGTGDSKTPAGYGEFMRKRINRIVEATGYVGLTTESHGAFFSPIPQDQVTAVLDKLESGAIGIWQGYNSLGDLRKVALEGTKAHRAFDPAFVIGMAAKLGEKGAIEAFASSTALQVAYGQLVSAVSIVNAAATVHAAETAAKAA